MANLPEEVSKAWDQREAPAILTTVDGGGKPNSIYVGKVEKYGDDKIVVADNYFNKTRANIKNGSAAALLFITPERASYQIKGDIDYLTEGPIYDEMKSWNGTKHPGVAAAVVNVREVYKGGEQLV